MNKEELMIVVYTTHGHTYSFYEVSNIKYHNKNLEFDYKGFAGETHAQFNDITGITKHYGVKNPNKKHDKDKQFYSTLTHCTAELETPKGEVIRVNAMEEPKENVNIPIPDGWKSWEAWEFSDYINYNYCDKHLSLSTPEYDKVWAAYWDARREAGDKPPFFVADEFINKHRDLN